MSPIVSEAVEEKVVEESSLDQDDRDNLKEEKKSKCLLKTPKVL